MDNEHTRYGDEGFRNQSEEPADTISSFDAFAATLETLEEKQAWQELNDPNRLYNPIIANGPAHVTVMKKFEAFRNNSK